ncbi:MAG: hypothetical protein ACLSA0_16255 [Eisenbergiella massiliensis]
MQILIGQELPGHLQERFCQGKGLCLRFLKTAKREPDGFRLLYPRKCQHPEKIAKWLSWMSSEEGITFCVYGEEGVDYTLDEQGGYVETELGEEKKTGLCKQWSDSLLAVP